MDPMGYLLANNPSQSAHPCGVCGKHVHGCQSTHYVAKCNVCNKLCSVHAKKSCINQLWKQTMFGKNATNPSQMVSCEVFNAQANVGLFCNDCKKPCFYCNKFHNSGKYFCILQ